MKPLYRRPITLGVLLACSFVVTGCANYQREVQIQSEPPGATIYVNGEFKGQTPENKLVLDFGNAPEARKFIQVCKGGYMPGYATWTMREVEDKKFELAKIPQ